MYKRQEKSATRTIKYVDRNGNEVSETRVETIKVTRDAKVNLVTGEITYGEWTTDRNDDIFNGYPVPVVKGYIACLLYTSTWICKTRTRSTSSSR